MGLWLNVMLEVKPGRKRRVTVGVACKGLFPSFFLDGLMLPACHSMSKPLW